MLQFVEQRFVPCMLDEINKVLAKGEKRLAAVTAGKDATMAAVCSEQFDSATSIHDNFANTMIAMQQYTQLTILYEEMLDGLDLLSISNRPVNLGRSKDLNACSQHFLAKLNRTCLSSMSGFRIRLPSTAVNSCAIKIESTLKTSLMSLVKSVSMPTARGVRNY